MNKKGYFNLIAAGAFVAVFLLAFSAYGAFDGWVQSVTQGPEYCFENIDKSSVSLASQGVEVRYTQAEGSSLCFRTKDSSIPERLNQQIQDRELKEALARIESSDRFWNETFPIIFFFGITIIAVIFMIMFFSDNRNNVGYY